MFPLCSPSESLSSLLHGSNLLGSHYQRRLDMMLISVWITSNSLEQPWQSLMFPFFNHFTVFMCFPAHFLFVYGHKCLFVSVLYSGRSVYISNMCLHTNAHMQFRGYPLLMEMQNRPAFTSWVEYRTSTASMIKAKMLIQHRPVSAAGKLGLGGGMGWGCSW